MTICCLEEPVSVAVVDDHELVVRGVAAMLAPHADRVAVVAMGTDTWSSPAVDIVLFDTSLATSQARALEDLVANPLVGEVIFYTWDLTEEIIASAAARGVHSALSKSLDGVSLVTALTLTHDVAEPLEQIVERVAVPTESWVGHERLTARESEIITLITGGLSNQDIAERTYLSINSVKSYIRSAYRTMGVTSPSQAILWGIDHGLAPTRARVAAWPSAQQTFREGSSNSRDQTRSALAGESPVA